MTRHPPRLWYSVETPSVFREYELPIDDEAMTREDWERYCELKDLAEAHGAHLIASIYRRG